VFLVPWRGVEPGKHDGCKRSSSSRSSLVYELVSVTYLPAYITVLPYTHPIRSLFPSLVLDSL